MRSKGLYSLVALEAAAVGTPIITSPGEVTFAAGTSEQEIVDGVSRVLRNPQEAREFANRAQEIVNKRYTQESQVERYLELYRR